LFGFKIIFLSAVGDGGKKIVSAFADIASEFLPPSPTAIKIFQRRRR
jgi:hypothetical protein